MAILNEVFSQGTLAISDADASPFSFSGSFAASSAAAALVSAAAAPA